MVHIMSDDPRHTTCELCGVLFEYTDKHAIPKYCETCEDWLDYRSEEES